MLPLEKHFLLSITQNVLLQAYYISCFPLKILGDLSSSTPLNSFWQKLQETKAKAIHLTFDEDLREKQNTIDLAPDEEGF